MNEIDIFDTKNIDDIPSDIRNKFRVSKKSKNKIVEDNIIELIKMSNDALSLDQIHLGYYRFYNIVLRRDFLRDALLSISRKPDSPIEKVVMSKEDRIRKLGSQKGIAVIYRAKR